MLLRDKQLVDLRTSLALPQAESVVEQFQNNTLRPVLKFQHDVLVASWHKYAEEQKSTFYKLNRPDQLTYLRAAIQTNRAYRNFVLGLVCGVFTKVEWQAFRQNEKELTRRIMTLLVERLLSEAEIFNPVAESN